MKKIYVEKTLYTIDDLHQGKVSKGDHIEHKGEVYVFDGYEYGTYPIATHFETGKQIELPWR